MLVVDLMTRDIITVTRETPVLEALKIMHQHDFRRLPVVDEDGRPVGVVSQRSIDKLKPSGIPLLWQAGSWASKHTVGEVMNKRVISVKPTDTVEFATYKAQSNKVGSLLVVENSKMVGIVTTNDIFYKVVNPTLGLNEPGSRIVVIGGGTGKNAVEILSAINRLGIEVKVIWAVVSPTNRQNNLVVHLDTDDARKVVSELTRMGYETRIVNR
ncbi:MAG TPA: CBS domain-containing protein [Dehalococcoidales bacterium]|nr:CBS domain-containing protein [Dehalococcoidales bacterium]